ncbi:L-lactate dehydrogenase [Lactobacillus helsingborgensis]|uniref:lactate/malate family dehydrogenase n=1 Tax=Lactobacillus helsingborgensis TaxID=1218494 RepID=UPI002741B9D4|nr:L-lactate dehydrogenase [Lactobacillus helsingborgensis]WLT00484.1 L-lactate dehydrogenase [Lactobacillus helsingborgensis]
MHKIAIIGLGHVGATVAYTLFTHGTAGQLLLFDRKADKIESEYRDLHDAIARDHYTVNVYKADWDNKADWAKLKDFDLIVSAFGDISATARTGSRQAELEENTVGVREISAKIKNSGFNGILLNITNPCDVIVDLYAKYTGLPKKHVFGTGTFLDTSRMKRFVAEKLAIDPHNVHGYVIAEHGAEQFTAWSTVSAAGKKADEIFTEEQEKQLSSEPNHSSKVVSKGKGYTNWAIASTAWRLIEDIFSDAHAVVPVSNYDAENDLYLSWPVVLGQDGILKRCNLHLTKVENEKYQTAVKAVKDRIEKTNQF